MKLNKKELDVAITLGMLSAIMTQDGRLEEVYRLTNEEWGIGGIVDTSYVFTWWAMEFMELHKDTDWESLYGDEVNIEWLSKKYKETWGGFQESWDICAEDFAQWKLENYSKEEFNRINCSTKEIEPLLKK